MSSVEKWMTAVMVITAALGTLWYLLIELQTKNMDAVGWSVVAVIWFVVLRRVVHLWARGRRGGENEK
jgi:TRAP-type uncharacterized transport system fused permease subunit